MKPILLIPPVIGFVAIAGYGIADLQEKSQSTRKLEIRKAGISQEDHGVPTPEAFAKFACGSTKLPPTDYFGKPLPKGPISLMMGGDCTTCSLVPKILLGHFKTKYQPIYVVQADPSSFEKNLLKNYKASFILFDKEGKIVDQKALRGLTYEIWRDDEHGYTGGREAVREN